MAPLRHGSVGHATASWLFASLTAAAKVAIAENDQRVKALVFGAERDRYDADIINATISMCEKYARKVRR